MSTTKDPKDMTYEELEALMEGKKKDAVKALKSEVAELRAILSKKEAKLEKMTGVPVVVPGRRGRKPGSGKTGAPRGKRSSGLKNAVLSFLGTKGKEGAHVDDIAKHVGKPKANVNAFLATTGKKNGVKGKGKRSGIYFLEK